MTDLFLIAHKVRGEPAFDIAEHMTCPHCNGEGKISAEGTFEDEDCYQCDGAGHWWIIPTSGHRAFPYWACQLMTDENTIIARNSITPRHPFILLGDDMEIPPMPPDLRDHYTTEREVARSLVDVLGLIHKPLAPIKRRF